MKKYLHKNNELNTPLTKLEMFTITKRVVNAYACFDQGYCTKCKCNMVDAINTKSYSCEKGCFGPAFSSDEEFEAYDKVFVQNFTNSVLKRDTPKI